ncbi:hypothetical protein KSC_012500 [Ktedonobacter sp. SOSP1-52]|nr:hypothetical protein KSC_012500 [Ktedonobacter sp. SOSP1-52]
MPSDELIHYVKLKELHTWWYQISVFSCGLCSHVCTDCRQALQLPSNNVLNLHGYSEQDIQEVSNRIKAARIALQCR